MITRRDALAATRAPADSRGLAMGAYTAFLDVALGFGTPALGLIANVAGLGAVLVSAVAALCSAPIAASFVANHPARQHLRAMRNAVSRSKFNERRST
jgi:hypothetical protein